jgi:hypothetical protein
MGKISQQKILHKLKTCKADSIPPPNPNRSK